MTNPSLKRRIYLWLDSTKTGKHFIFVWHHFRDRLKFYLAERDASSLQDLNLKMDITDGFLRLGLTSRCNAKCRFCGFWKRVDFEENLDMPKEYLYQYCLPLYEKVKTLCLTDGEAIVSPEFIPFCDFISKKYPALTIAVETNGIGFSRTYQELAADNLMNIHFSLNAVSEEMYIKGVWDCNCPGAKTAYQYKQKNYLDYIVLLKEKNLLAFAPTVSMVVNTDTYSHIPDFIRFALMHHASRIRFYFDHSQIRLSESDFPDPVFQDALQQIMEIEKVLKDKVIIFYRLYLATQVCDKTQQIIDSENIDDLQKKYRDIIELAEGRSIIKEWQERQIIRKAKGKKTFALEEDIDTTMCTHFIDNKQVCLSPWKEFDIRMYENSPKFRFCAWCFDFHELGSFIKNGKIDWEQVANSSLGKNFRKDILCDKFTDCMDCCPLNPTYHKIYPALGEHNLSKENMQYLK